MSSLFAKLLLTCLAAAACGALPAAGGAAPAGAQGGGAWKFDSYGLLRTDDEAARLDAFWVELEARPGLKGYVVGYHGGRTPRGALLRRLHGDRRYLTETRGLDPGRVFVLDGGRRPELTVELWLVPEGARPPAPTPAAGPAPADDGKPYLFDVQCLDCGPAVNLDLYGLREGLQFFAAELLSRPAARGLILVRPGRGEGARSVVGDARQARKLLREKHGIDARRVAVRAGPRSRDGVAVAELWVTPRGARRPATDR